MSDVPPIRNFGSKLPAQRNEPAKRSGDMADEALDLASAAESYAKEANPETHWSEERKQESRQNSLFVPAFGLLALIGISAFVIWTVKRSAPSGGPPAAAPTAAAWTGEAPPPEVVVDGFLERLSFRELESLVLERASAYFQADTVEARSAHTLSYPGHLERMNHHYAQRPAELLPRDVSHVEVVNSTIGEVPVYAVSVFFTEETAPTFLTVLTAGDRFLIDWESTVGYCSTTLESVKKDRVPTPSQIRVFISYPNSSAKRLIPGEFRVSETANGLTFRLYVDPKSSAHETLKSWLKQPELIIPFNTLISYSQEERQLVLDEILHPYWFDTERYQKTHQIVQKDAAGE